MLYNSASSDEDDEDDEEDQLDSEGSDEDQLTSSRLPLFLPSPSPPSSMLHQSQGVRTPSLTPGMSGTTERLAAVDLQDDAAEGLDSSDRYLQLSPIRSLMHTATSFRDIQSSLFDTEDNMDLNSF